METLKHEAISAISKLPESASIDDIMYELYVIDKVKKGKEAAERGETVTVEDLRREMQSW
jgi:predicted transcriptional regulator